VTVPAAIQANATVVRIIDGDTLECRVPILEVVFGIETARIRIRDINAREHNEPGGPEALANLIKLCPLRSPVVLHGLHPDRYDGRFDADVETPAISDLGAWLVAQQWAAHYPGSGPKLLPPWPRTVSS
jgi:endonuclease YncB( thermonuclease family)